MQNPDPDPAGQDPDWPFNLIPKPAALPPGGTTWVTRKGIRVNRTATAWLIRRFIDPDATFLFVEPHDVAEAQAAHRGRGFDAPGAAYPHLDASGRCSFKALVEEFHPYDAALAEMALIVQGADIPGQPDQASECSGLRSISVGFPLVTRDDFETIEKAAFMYDALYASIKACQEEALEAGPVFTGPVTSTRAS